MIAIAASITRAKEMYSRGRYIAAFKLIENVRCLRVVVKARCPYVTQRFLYIYSGGCNDKFFGFE